MSKNANAGELRTPIRVFSYTEEINANGYPEKTERDVFGAVVRCKWVNAHGTDVLTAQQLGLKDPATLTLRYSPLITPECIIYRAGNPDPYAVISIDNVEQRDAWMEIKVQRQVRAI